jgi:hypothetical protein
MTFIDSFEEQLVQAATQQRDERLERRSRRFGWLRVPRGRGPAVVVAALLIGVPAATATTGVWNPFNDADRNPRFPGPSSSQRGVDPRLAATLGVLRRDQTDADRSIATRRAARAFAASSGYRGVQLRGIRVLDPTRNIVLIPFERGPVPLDQNGQPLPGIDPASYTNVACVFELTSDSYAGVGCHSADKIRSGRAIASGGGDVTGLVPDNVAQVRLIRGDQVVEADVHDNFFSVEDADAPLQVEWVRPDGSTARRIDLTEPAPGAPRPATP